LRETAKSCVPVPLRATELGLPDWALWVRVTVPVREPVAVGVNLMPMVQVAVGATVEPVQVSADLAKSPVKETFVIKSDAVPVLVTTIFFAALVVPTV
jgi:hypothetical protein